MFLEKKIEGLFVNLRSVQVEDAESILSLRNDPIISRYLPPLNVTVEQQKQWIMKQMADNDSYYFIIEDKNLRTIGTIGIYDIVNKHGEGGRYCSIGDAIQNVEAMILLSDFAFNIIMFDYMTCWVFEDNTHILSLNKGIGYDWIKTCEADEGLCYKIGVLSKSQYYAKSIAIKNKIKRLYILKNKNNGN